MKKIVLSLLAVALTSSLSFGQTKTSEYNVSYTGYNYVGEWSDCIGERSIGGGSSGKVDVIGYDATEKALTLTDIGGHGGYSRSATYIPMVDATQVTYNPTNCTAVLPGLDISSVAAGKKKIRFIIKATSNVNVRFYVGQGSDGSNICSNNNTGTIGVDVTTIYDTLEIDLGVSGNLTSNGPCAVSTNVPLTALSFFGISPDFENGAFAGTVYIKQLIIGDTDFKSDVTSVLTTVNNSLISVYPNPANSQVNVDLTSIENLSNASLKIINANGMVVYDGVASNSIETVNISSLMKGIYMVQVTAGNKISNQKIVIN